MESSLNNQTPIWNSNLDVSIKRDFFKATVASVSTYSSQAQTLTKSLENKLNVAYTHMLAAAPNIHWSQRVSNKELYNALPKITETTRYRWSTFSGHIWTHDEETAHNLLLWMPTNGKKQKRKAAENIYYLTYEHRGLQTEELKTLMANREEWKSFINSNFPKRFD